MARVDPMLHRVDARDELRRLEVAVELALHERLAEQMDSGPARVDRVAVVVLLLHRHELVGDRVHVELGDLEATGRHRVCSSEQTAAGSAVMFALRVSWPRSRFRLSPAWRYRLITSGEYDDWYKQAPEVHALGPGGAAAVGRSM